MKLHGVLRYFQSSGNKLARLGISGQQREHVFTAEYDQSGGGSQNGSYDLSARSVSG